MTPYASVIVGYKRPAGLLRAVRGALRQSPAPKKVLVWHNDPSRELLPIDGVLQVRCSENLGCGIRHLVALSLLQESIITFHDDDVYLNHPGVLPALVAAAEKNSGGVVGAHARTLVPGERPYSRARDVKCVDQVVDVVKGLLHACDRECLHRLVELHASGSVQLGDAYEDDIALSAAATMRGAIAVNRTVAVKPEWFELHNDSVGLQRRPDHYQRRDSQCLKLIALGWNPLYARSQP